MKPKRTTVDFDPSLHEALRLKAVSTDRSVSDVVDEAVRVLLAEDLEDLSAIKARRDEPTVSFESFLMELREDGQELTGSPDEVIGL